MFERIMVPLDGSERAEVILDQIRRFLVKDDAEIILVRVVDPCIPVYGGYDVHKLLEAERAEARRYLDEKAKKLSALAAAKVHARVVEGPPAEAILAAAQEEGATMLALATHGRRGLTRWTLGSIAERIVRASDIPVYLARSFRPGPRAPFWEPAPAVDQPVRRILFPTDGSEASRAAIAPTEKLALLFGAEVVVLHVIPPMPAMVGVEAAWVSAAAPPLPSSEEDEVTGPTAVRFAHAGLRVSRRTLLGDPAREIVDHAFDPGIDLIAMATHGRSGAARWILGSVAEKVLRHAQVPLLLVRATGTQSSPLKEESAAARK